MRHLATRRANEANGLVDNRWTNENVGLVEDAAANMAENQQPRRYPVNSISRNRVYNERGEERVYGTMGHIASRHV